MNTFNDDRRNETDELSVMINELPQVDPPPTMVGTVMSTIAQFSRTHGTRPPVTLMRRGNTMAKKVLWSVAAAAAAALVVMRVAGYPPVEKGTEATIGAAQRYQSQQIAAADVKVENPELQAFLQSDLFRQLVADKAAQRVLKSKDFQRAISDVSVRAALARQDVMQLISYVRIDVAALDAANVASLDAANVRSLEAAAIRLDAAKVVSLDAAQMALDGIKLDAASLEAAMEAIQGAIQASPNLAFVLAAPGAAQAIAASSLSAVFARPEAAIAVAQEAGINAVLSAAGNAAGNAVGNAAGSAAPSAAPAGDAAVN